MRLLLIALFAALSPSLAWGKVPPEVMQLRQVPGALDPDKAYLLFRSSRAKTGLLNIEHVLLRVPGEKEIEAYHVAKQAEFEKQLPKLRKKVKDGEEPSIDAFAFEYDGPANAFAVDAGDFLEDGAEERTYLVQVPAGDYVLYGVSAGGRAVTTCNCLGTVRFEARPGVATFLGGLYADKVHKESPVPHLEDNRGPSMFNYGFVLGQALVPPGENVQIPAIVSGIPVVRAEYSAVGQFHDPMAAGINRLAPVPGVLAYDRGTVIDLRTGQRFD